MAGGTGGRAARNGVIYTLTVRDADHVAAWLRSRGLDVEAYSAETGERRVELEDALLNNRLKALVATTALGMGFDKPDLAFVFHYQTPGSVVAYYQQVGRAGRALSAAYGVLLSGAEETDITDYFIESAFPVARGSREMLAPWRRLPTGSPSCRCSAGSISAMEGSRRRCSSCRSNRLRPSPGRGASGRSRPRS